MIEIIKAMYPLLLKALIITVVVEEICLLIMREKDYKVYLICLITNIITNLSMNVALQMVNNYYLWLVIFEVLVFVIESLVYLLFKKKISKAILYSLICNVCSLVVGILI